MEKQITFKYSPVINSPTNDYACYLNFIPKNIVEMSIKRLVEIGAYGIISIENTKENYCTIHFWCSLRVIENIKSLQIEIN